MPRFDSLAYVWHAFSRTVMGCQIAIHQSDILLNMWFSLTNAHSGIQCSGMQNSKSFVQTLSRGLVL